MREVLADLLRWWSAGDTVGMATVTGTFRSAPRPPGAAMLVGADGTAVIHTQAPSFGMAYDPDDPTMVLSDGRAPATAGEVALGSTSARDDGGRSGRG